MKRLLLFLILALSAHGQILTPILSGSSVASGGGGATLVGTPTYAYPATAVTQSGVTAGNAVIAACSWNDKTSIPTAAGFTALTPSRADATGAGSVSLFYQLNSAGGNITLTTSGCGTDCGCVIAEFSGVKAAAALDGSVVNTNAAGGAGTATPTSSSITTTAGDLVFVAWMDELQNPSTCAAGTGFTRLNFGSAHYDCQEYLLKAISPSYAPSFTMGASSTQWAISAAAFLTN